MELLKRGSRGQAVTELQEQLTRLGYRLAIDGIFGKETERNVKAFQTRAKIAIDGIVGDQTRRALAKALKVPVNNVIQSMRPISPTSPGTGALIFPTRPSTPTIKQSSSRWEYWLGFGILGAGALLYYLNQENK